MMPAPPGAGLVLIQPHVALLGFEFRLDAPSGAAHISQGFQGSVRRGVGQIVTGFAAVPVPAIDNPDQLEVPPDTEDETTDDF